MKKVFTLIEMVIVIWMLSTALLTLIIFISKSVSFASRTEKVAIATNIAREWIEWVFNIRNTNWVKYAWKKDSCWLKLDPEEGGDNDCSNDDWIKSGYYILSWKKIGDNFYFYLSGVSVDLNIEDWIDSFDKVYQLCNNNGYWQSCANTNLEPKDYKYWRYFRQIRVLWLVNKNAGIGDPDYYLTCVNWQSCGSNHALELQFCSKVWYVADHRGYVELCSVLTNFNP